MSAVCPGIELNIAGISARDLCVKVELLLCAEC